MSKQNRAEHKENEMGEKKEGCSQAGYKGKKLEKRTAGRCLLSESLGKEFLVRERRRKKEKDKCEPAGGGAKPHQGTEMGQCERAGASVPEQQRQKGWRCEGAELRDREGLRPALGCAGLYR